MGRHATVYKLDSAQANTDPEARNHCAVTRHQTCGQWETELVAPGNLGVPCSFGEEWESWTSTATFNEKEEPDANAHQEAEDVIFSLSRRLTTCDKRRVAPACSVHDEVWLQVLRPNWRKHQVPAVGAVSHALAAPTFLVAIYQSPRDCAPQPWSGHCRTQRQAAASPHPLLLLDASLFRVVPEVTEQTRRSPPAARTLSTETAKRPPHLRAGWGRSKTGRTMHT